MKNLLSPVQLGSLALKNRIILSPMTRMRAEAGGVPGDLMAEYYEQRASFGLVITECAPINATCNSYPGAGGIYNEAQAAGWRKVVERIHRRGGKAVLQIFHGGRSGSKAILGADPVAPSPIAINAVDLFTQKPYDTPKELTIPLIEKLLDEFEASARLAKQAGFDGVQLHAANGYLVDQFLRDTTNVRTDKYGGSIEARSLFCVEATERLAKVFGSQAVGVRLSPTDRFNGMFDSNPLGLVKHLLPRLDRLNLAFIEVKRNSPFDASKDTSGRPKPEDQIPDFFKTIKSLIRSTPYVANQSLSIEEAQNLIETGVADAVSFATLGISNPDLPERVKNSHPLNRKPDFTKAYFGGAAGYTDYPTYEQEKK